MRQADLSSRLLKVQLTEDVPEPEELYLSASLTAIRAKGFQMSMDNFGAAAATLNLLVNLSFDEMKIDGSFVRCVEQHSSSRKVIAGIVNWACLLNLNLVTEGIEDESIIPLFYRLGCLCLPIRTAAWSCERPKAAIQFGYVPAICKSRPWSRQVQRMHRRRLRLFISDREHEIDREEATNAE